MFQFEKVNGNMDVMWFCPHLCQVALSTFICTKEHPEEHPLHEAYTTQGCYKAFLAYCKHGK